MWELDYNESWAPKIDAFELWCWRRLLRVPWTARRSNQSILKKSLLGVQWKVWRWSWNSSTLATWCEELTLLKRPWCWERLRAGGDGVNRRWDGWMASLTHGFGWTPGLVDGQGGLVCCSSWVAKNGTQLSDWTELNWAGYMPSSGIAVSYDRFIPHAHIFCSQMYSLRKKNPKLKKNIVHNDTIYYKID